MSLKLRDTFDNMAYVNAVIANGTRKLVAGGSSSGTGEIRTNSTDSNGGGLLYLVGRDRLYAIAHVSSTQDPVTGLLKLDPFFLKTAPPDTEFQTHRSPIFAPITLRPGQYNPATGEHYFYVASNASGPVYRVDPDSLVHSNAPAFTGPNGDFWFGSSNTLSSVEGYFLSLQNRQGLIFEGLTAGIPGETLLTAPGSYPLGLFLTLADSKIGGVNHTDGWVWVDLQTKRAVGRLGGYPTPTLFSAKVTATPGAQDDQYEQPIADDSFKWGAMQYIPDADATLATPKGQLFFCNTIEVPTGPTAPGDAAHFYFRFVDFNPFGAVSATGVPTRTHGRVRFTTRANVILEPAFGVAGRHGGALNDLSIAFDSMRQRFIVGLEENDVVGSPPDYGDVTTKDTTFGIYGFEVDPSYISPPTARDIPRTDSVVDFESVVRGDIGEPVQGVTVNFALTRRSTKDELLTISGGIGTTSTVQHPAIDVMGDGTPELLITADGVLLALTTDYTVVAATGVITWVTSQSGKIVKATYNHRATGTTPAFGTLLTTEAVTDENGRATAQVAYGTDESIVGQLDALTATF